MLKKDKISSYLKYGMVEMAMVVVGILIALQINNWNEKRKDNKRILRILTEMQQDLWSDIQECDALSHWAKDIDSLSVKIINSEIADSAYMKPEGRRLFQVGTATYPLVVTDIAFQKLSGFNGEIPEKYDEVINKMNRLYIEEKMYIEEAFTRLNDYTLENYNDRYRNFGWMTDLHQDNITPEILDYFQHNDKYKSQIIRYRRLLSVLAGGNTLRFKNTAIRLYFEIEEITKTSDIPEGLEAYAPAQDTTTLMPYLGIYREGEDDPYPAVISHKEGRLFASNRMLFNTAEDTFQYVIYPKHFIYFKRDSSNEVIGAVFKWAGALYNCEKME